MSDEDPAELSMRLQPRGQIHLVTNDGIVHPVLTAEIANSAEASVDPDAQLEWLFEPRSIHLSCSSRIRRCMAIAILTQAMASSLLPRLAGSPKNPMIASPTYVGVK